jgi:hypothetical protein
MLEELQEEINFNLELIFQYGGNHLKSHGEKKLMEISKLGLEIVKENKIMMPHPLKEYLGVKCATVCDCLFRWHSNLQ